MSSWSLHSLSLACVSSLIILLPPTSSVTAYQSKFYPVTKLAKLISTPCQAISTLTHLRNTYSFYKLQLKQHLLYDTFGGYFPLSRIEYCLLCAPVLHCTSFLQSIHDLLFVNVFLPLLNFRVPEGRAHVGCISVFIAQCLSQIEGAK